MPTTNFSASTGRNARGDDGPHARRDAAILRLIGIFKLLKATALIVGAAVAASLVHQDVAEFVSRWSHHFHLAPGNQYVEHVVERLLKISPKKWKLLAVILAIYAAMFMVEGIGLLFLQHWAEWMTVFTTAGLIPFELYELTHKPTAAKALALIANVIVAIYMVWRVRRNMQQKHAHDRHDLQSTEPPQ